MNYLDECPNFELVMMLEAAYAQERWDRYDVIFETLRLRGAFE